MKNFFRIARWEYITRFRSRSFLFSTFILPMLFSLLITLPAFFLTYEEEVSTKLIGVVNLGERSLVTNLQKQLNKNFRLKNGTPEYVVMPVSVDNSPDYKKAHTELQIMQARMDSITQAYNAIKDLRVQYYNRRNLPNKNYLLQKTYDEMVETRELKDLIEIELETHEAKLDSVFNSEARRAADSLLFKQVLNAYLVIPEDIEDNSVIEYHTYTPGNLLEAERLHAVLNEIIIEARMANANINTRQISEWLEPVQLKKYQWGKRLMLVKS